jgi:hypothetical protein
MDLIKNVRSSRGKQQYLFKSCGRRGVVNPEARHSEAEKEQIIVAYFERPSMKGQVVSSISVVIP